MPKSKIKRIHSAAGFVTYLRTSSEEAQAPERSQDAQRRDLEQRLLRTYTLPSLGEYVDNYTGTTADRKHYQRLLSDARLGKFSHVFAATPDRFGRDDVEALRAIDEMTQLGITVRFASHPDLNPANEDDRMYLNILFGMAKREAAVTARRVRGGMTSKLLGGGWSWRAPDGYLNKEIRLTELGAEEQLKHAKYKRWIEIDPEQSKVWRLAWDLLLTDRYSLDDICKKLHEQGYRMTSGRPFIKVRPDRAKGEGEHIAHIQLLSRAFHNWFYAGWVVAQNEWVDIAPKTVKGEWDAVVTTEEFERGLAILAQRNHKPMPHKKHFYLLQGLVYLETAHGLRKLTCGMPNFNRKRGGVAYYCVPSSATNYLCHKIDPQITDHLASIQISPELLPQIRQTYLSDVHRYTKDIGRERRALETRRRKLDEKELNLWRAFTDHGMRPQIYEQLTRECEEERENLTVLLKHVEAEQGDSIENLDAALHVLAEIGERYVNCVAEQQRAILLQMVERVILTAEGQVRRIEWKPPFCYIQGLKDGSTNGGQDTSKKARKSKTSRVAAGSLSRSFGAPNYNKVGQLSSPMAATADGSLSYFLEHIAYPQREQIGRLLASNLT